MFFANVATNLGLQIRGIKYYEVQSSFHSSAPRHLNDFFSFPSMQFALDADSICCLTFGSSETRTKRSLSQQVISSSWYKPSVSAILYSRFDFLSFLPTCITLHFSRFRGRNHL